MLLKPGIAGSSARGLCAIMCTCVNKIYQAAGAFRHDLLLCYVSEISPLPLRTPGSVFSPHQATLLRENSPPSYTLFLNPGEVLFLVEQKIWAGTRQRVLLLWSQRSLCSWSAWRSESMAASRNHRRLRPDVERVGKSRGAYLKIH